MYALGESDVLVLHLRRPRRGCGGKGERGGALYINHHRYVHGAADDSRANTEGGCRAVCKLHMYAKLVV